jgi:hypothetical protein
MVAPVIALLLAFLASAVAIVNFNKCYGGNYCSPYTALKAQPGVFANPEACGNKCAQNAAYKYFSYVPSSKQCLCSPNCNTLVPNPNVDSYCINPTPSYVLCKNYRVCADDVTKLKPLTGYYPGPGDCAEACYQQNHANTYINFMGYPNKCTCVKQCNGPGETYHATVKWSVYKINSAVCDLKDTGK